MHHVQVVGDEQVGELAFGLELLQQVEHLGLHRLVQRRHGLVEDHQARVEGQGAGNVDPLALAARQFVGVAAGELLRRQADAGQQIVGLAFGLGGRHAVHLGAVGDGLGDGQARVEGGKRVLEDHLQAAPEFLQADAAEFIDALAVEHHAARVGLHQAGDEPGGGGLATAGFADDAQGLALGHREADPIDGMDELLRPFEGATAHREMLLEVAHDEQRLGRAAPVLNRAGGMGSGVHRRMSMAERTLSASRLNAMEVTKIRAPGRAAIQGLT